MSKWQIDPNTNKPFRTQEELEIWKDLEYFIRTGKHRKPAKVKWITKKKMQA